MALGAVMVAALVGAAPLSAQVGFSSNLAQVALVVRVAPRASIEGVSPPVQSTGQGSLTEASVKVRLSTNTGYRLVVVGTASSQASRLWVRTSSGDFQELVPGASVTVAQGQRAAGQLEREVSYKLEAAADAVESLPVRYEIVVTPTI
jgi:hypothetical protein